MYKLKTLFFFFPVSIRLSMAEYFSCVEVCMESKVKAFPGLSLLFNVTSQNDSHILCWRDSLNKNKISLFCYSFIRQSFSQTPHIVTRSHVSFHSFQFPLLFGENDRLDQHTKWYKCDETKSIFDAQGS